MDGKEYKRFKVEGVLPLATTKWTTDNKYSEKNGLTTWTYKIERQNGRTPFLPWEWKAVE